MKTKTQDLNNLVRQNIGNHDMTPILQWIPPTKKKNKKKNNAKKTVQRKQIK